MNVVVKEIRATTTASATIPTDSSTSGPSSLFRDMCRSESLLKLSGQLQRDHMGSLRSGHQRTSALSGTLVLEPSV